MKRGHYIGLDLAMEVSVACVVDQEGRVLQHTKIVTEEEMLRSFLVGVPRPRHLLVEESTQTEWILTICRELCDRAASCKTFENGALSGEKKSDERDAYNLAQKLRTNDFIEVWHDTNRRRKDLMQYALTYMAMVKESTREKNRIRAVFRAEGIKGAQLAYELTNRDAAVAKLPLEGEKHRVVIYGTALDSVMKLRKQAWSAFYKEAKKYTLFKRLLKTPGFGNVSAALGTAIIWDPSRFKNKRHFWSYCGFSLRTKDTSEFYVHKKTKNIQRKGKRLTLGLTREHNRIMKYLFKRASRSLIRKQWQVEFQRIVSKGVSRENATLTIARKVAAIALHLAKHGGAYEEARAFIKHH